jgi:hypothetical protein
MSGTPVRKSVAPTLDCLHLVMIEFIRGRRDVQLASYDNCLLMAAHAL